MLRPLFLILLLSFAGSLLRAEPFYPSVHPLTPTRWDAEIPKDCPLPEYPRPQMVRTDWQNLNGPWNYAVVGQNDPQPKEFSGKILVPYPYESFLSGVTKMLTADQRLWYWREFNVPSAWAGKRILLNFGAVSYEAAVYVNGKKLAEHSGDYDGFSVDITDALKPAGPQELIVSAWDPVQAGIEPHGKQSTGSYSIWHAASSGIWETVWLEPVAASNIGGLKLVPDVDKGALNLVVNANGAAAGDTVEAVALADGKEVGRISGAPNAPLALTVPNAQLWSSEHPFLYDLKVSLLRDGKAVDSVGSYFGMRKVSWAKDAKGIPRIYLNNQPVFSCGTLDQGYWPEGEYTAPTDDALRYDLEMLKKYGFNMDRIHVKIQPDRWYYWADKLGVLVWQDMPSSANGGDARVPDAQAAEFEKELKAMIDGRGNHPCIMTWIIFNESWGEYDTHRLTDWLHQYDPTRVVDSVSGFIDNGAGDVNDRHDYGFPPSAPVQDGRVSIIGEFGGMGGDGLADKYTNLMKLTADVVTKSHVNATVFSCLTDVEQEAGGATLTSDRKTNVDPTIIAAANKVLRDAAAADEAATAH